jgi:hypothetical protein
MLFCFIHAKKLIWILHNCRVSINFCLEQPLPSLSPAGILNSKATDEIWLEVVAGTVVGPTLFVLSLFF